MQVISAGWARGTCSVQVTPVGPSSPLSCQLTVWSPGSLSVRVRVWSARRWVRVTLPPLRDRPEDILPLAERFLSQYAARYGKNITAIDRTAAEKLGAYPWYGNIRELQHAVEKAVILCEGERLQAADFVLAQRDETVMPGGVTTLEEMESSLIRRAMDQHKGNLSQVAVQLGITRQTLYNKIKKYNL